MHAAYLRMAGHGITRRVYHQPHANRRAADPAVDSSARHASIVQYGDSCQLHCTLSYAP